MRFRDNDELMPILLEADSPEGLLKLVDNRARLYDFIDLQYSTTTLLNGSIHYSVFILAADKKENAK